MHGSSPNQTFRKKVYKLFKINLPEELCYRKFQIAFTGSSWGHKIWEGEERGIKVQRL